MKPRSKTPTSTTPAIITRAYIYSRVSTLDGQQLGSKSQSIENQLDPIKRYCESQNWIISGEYIDRESGRKRSSDRPGLNQLFTDIESTRLLPGVRRVVVVWALDRLTREGTLSALQYLDRISQSGAAFHSLQEPFLDTTGPLGDIIVSIFAALAKMESVRMSERVQAGMERARKQGKSIGRPRRAVDSEVFKTLIEKGWNNSQIAESLGISLRSVVRLRSQYKTKSDT